MAKGEPDQELRKAFMELQGKMQETNQKLRIADVQVESLKKQIVHAQLTDKEIQSLGENTRVYESVGRMFLLTDIPMVRENLKAKVTKCNERITNLQANKEYLERSMAESQNNLREMIKLKQSVGAA
ncbi:prefoldin subunit 1 [Panulirus ornatus]|uniref:prefoldin subunit 1 n=1 Tax=Panulirus ornatus TaxID=150431 RepID=UPI003A87737E